MGHRPDMKIFRKEADYAVRTLLYLAMRGGEEYVSATTLSKELGLPVNFLRRICSTLIKANILATREGKNGGVKLVQRPAAIAVLQLIELFDGKPELSDCTFRKKLCPNRKTCVLRKRILGIENIINREFAALTIQSLIDDILTPNPYYDHVLFSMRTDGRRQRLLQHRRLRKERLDGKLTR